MDMNSSPLNPDAPVFVPSVGPDVLLAGSPRKPVPMDDIELPDAKQFETEAEVRPADLLDLDNCDVLNGHHVCTLLFFSLLWMLCCNIQIMGTISNSVGTFNCTRFPHVTFTGKI